MIYDRTDTQIRQIKEWLDDTADEIDVDNLHKYLFPPELNEGNDHDSIDSN